jgi:di/tricarboxylate transporter
MPIQRELILLIIIVAYVGVAVGAFPYLRMNRATIALVGAVALIIAGAVSFKEAAASLDADTLVLLFAMMIVNVHLRLAGFSPPWRPWLLRLLARHAPCSPASWSHRQCFPHCF